MKTRDDLIGHYQGQSLTEKVRAERDGILQQSNWILTYMFWSIGNIILYSPWYQQKKQLTKAARELQSKHGALFTVKNLEVMKAFASLYPDMNMIHRFCMLISWPYIPLLVNFKEPEKGMFYALLADRESLTAEQLKKRIKAKEFEKTITTPKALSLLRKQFLVTKRFTIKNVYTEPLFTIQNNFLDKNIIQLLTKK